MLDLKNLPSCYTLLHIGSLTSKFQWFEQLEQLVFEESIICLWARKKSDKFQLLNKFKKNSLRDDR